MNKTENIIEIMRNAVIEASRICATRFAADVSKIIHRHVETEEPSISIGVIGDDCYTNIDFTVRWLRRDINATHNRRNRENDERNNRTE